MRFWPDESYFDSPKLALTRLKHLLRAKAVLCPGLKVTLVEPDGTTTEWEFADGLRDYLVEATDGYEVLPQSLLSATSMTMSTAWTGRSSGYPKAAKRCWRATLT
ncbi:hypothetical protein HORIV_24450 [Vreelandella olivaria]|uniref:Uncharacterized protein n=1 Tax=Vreelandella olivaria TaxID=390919 RepID=A0ABN5WST4_9GAMM|nr:hypothetical protein HORIV_24450 [Halomonas olivaria]